ncbi:hypothetical protein BDQ12DRAFT_683516 [Crucibulum laeve]|uniref:Uncharacterized protein n=1 Tax=Crucibulum laeve TaxID=68775 RepID=A0A5C3LZ17_9AGAR|nr:hypothetical protein BDQ12DRAFT_683516 [Crucibulum laeve]
MMEPIGIREWAKAWNPQHNAKFAYRHENGHLVCLEPAISSTQYLQVLSPSAHVQQLSPEDYNWLEEQGLIERGQLLREDIIGFRKIAHTAILMQARKNHHGSNKRPRRDY